MTGKIDVTRIIKDHWATLCDDRNNRYSVRDFLTFYGLPALVGASLIWFGVLFGKTISSALTTAFSVFAALLFNLLILIYDIVSKSNGNKNVFSLKSKFLRQIYSNISYSVLVSVSIIVFLLLYYLVFSLGYQRLSYVAAFLVYTLAGNFILTLLMVLKRVHILLSDELESPTETPANDIRKSA